MCPLKNRHFTLRKACTYLDHLAAHMHRDIGMLKPICAHNKECVVFLGGGGGVTPSLLNIKGLYPISWLSQKSKTNKTFPPPTLPPVLRGRGEKQCDRNRNERQKGGRRTFEASTQPSKKGRHQRKEVSERRVDLTERLFLRPEMSVCAYSAS